MLPSFELAATQLHVHLELREGQIDSEQDIAVAYADFHEHSVKIPVTLIDSFLYVALLQETAYPVERCPFSDLSVHSFHSAVAQSAYELETSKVAIHKVTSSTKTKALCPSRPTELSLRLDIKSSHLLFKSLHCCCRMVNGRMKEVLGSHSTDLHVLN